MTKPRLKASGRLSEPKTTLDLVFDGALLWLALVPVGVLALWQFQYLGLATTLGSQIATNDSAGWQTCSSSLAHGSISANIDWCFRRPVAIFLQAPMYWLAPNNAASWLILQTLLLGLLAWLLAVTAMRTLKSSRLFGFMTVMALSWPNVIYGSNFGPEGIALLLSYLSVVALLLFLDTKRLAWGLASGASALLALAARPGNFILTVVLCVTIIWWTWRFRHRILPVVLVTVVLLGIWSLPNRILHVVGFEDAGHSANSWATVYSAATPEQDNWNVAYVDFDVEAQEFGTESNEFGAAVRSGAIDLIQTNPDPFLQQLSMNALTLFDVGLITRALSVPGNPFPSPALVLNTLQSGVTENISTILATGSWILSWVIFLGLIWTAIRSLRGTHFSGEVASDGNSSMERRRLTLAILGLVTYAGALAFYSLVGHDESTRHLVQNVPFLALSSLVIGSEIASIRPKKSRTNKQASPRAQGLILGVALTPVVVISLIVLLEGLRQPQSIRAYSQCSESMRSENPRNFEIVAGVPHLSHTFFPTSSTWRSGNEASLWFIAPETNYYSQFLPQVEAGNFLTLRDAHSHETLQVFVPQRLMSDLDADLDADLDQPDLCLRRVTSGDVVAEMAISGVIEQTAFVQSN